MSNDVNDLLLAGGAKTVKFPTVGTTVKGTITALEQRQATDINGNPETWDSGEPKMQIIVTLDTDERDPDVDDDDGSRRLFVKGNLFAELRKAVKASGQRLAIGGVIEAKYHADGEAKRGLSAPKLFKVRYTPPPPPTVSMGADDDDGW